MYPARADVKNWLPLARSLCGLCIRTHFGCIRVAFCSVIILTEQVLRFCGICKYHLISWSVGCEESYGSGSSVGLATGYGLDGPRIESRWGRDFPDRPWGPPSLLYNGYRVFPRGRSGRGVTLTLHPLLVPWSWKSRAIPRLPLLGRAACTEPQCLCKGALYLSGIMNCHLVTADRHRLCWLSGFGSGTDRTAWP